MFFKGDPIPMCTGVQPGVNASSHDGTPTEHSYRHPDRKRGEVDASGFWQRGCTTNRRVSRTNP